MNYESTYTLRAEEIAGITRYFARFKDGADVAQEVEVSQDIHAALKQSLTKEESLARSDRRRIEHCELSDAELYDRATYRPKSVEDVVLGQLQNERLVEEIAQLPETMRRRFVLYHHRGLTLKQIGEAEGCAFQVVARSIKSAESKVKKFLTQQG
ncbi:MAG: sigma-70 family RNA polymerase sigma factor [Oscillospiraceae bacterium]|nr:sigma-70 family RNA polymerase sigma factor [Oscillospiraceae bacterium]